MEVVEEGRVKPKSLLVRSVSGSVFITVRNITTLSGSLWYTPSFRGNGGVNQSSVETEADSPEYQDCNSLQNSEGA